MLTMQVEPWETLWPDLEPIWREEHSRELGPHRQLHARELMDELFAAWDKQGVLHALTVRTHETLVGYYVSLVQPFFNARGVIVATVLLYYVRQNWRHQGIGRALLRLMEGHMRAEGVQLLMTVTKTSSPHAAFLEQLGYEANEVTYTKWLRE